MRWARSTATDGIDIARSRDLGLGAGALAGRERGAEELVENRAGRALDQRQLVGALDLPLNLGLADDHRVEPGGDPEQVARGRGATQRVEVADELGRRRLGLAREQPEHEGLAGDRVRDAEVELGPVAGRDRRRLADLVVMDQLAEQPDRPALGQRQPLAQLQRRGLVPDAQRQKISSSRAPPRVGLCGWLGAIALREFRELGELAVDALRGGSP